jgi:hypothetical protein
MVSNEPTILPAIMSLSIFNRAPSGFESTYPKFLELNLNCLFQIHQIYLMFRKWDIHQSNWIQLANI